MNILDGYLFNQLMADSVWETCMKTVIISAISAIVAQKTLHLSVTSTGQLHDLFSGRGRRLLVKSASASTSSTFLNLEGLLSCQVYEPAT